MLEPLQLLLIVGVVDWELIGGAVWSLAAHSQLLAGSKGRETDDRDLVSRLNLVIVGRVVEGEAEHSLLLEVGLMDASKALHDDGTATCMEVENDDVQIF